MNFKFTSFIDIEKTFPFSNVGFFGIQYFQRYSSLQIDYDNMRIAFSGNHDGSHFEKHKNGNGGTIALIIILVVVGVVLIGTGVWWYLRRKNLHNNLNRYEQL